jgi:uncharacterized protein
MLTPPKISPPNRFAMLACLLAAAVSLTSAGVPAAAHHAMAAPYLATEEVSFRSGDVILHGTVLAPRSVGVRRPGIVLVHGSGTGVSRENLRGEAEAFAAGGIVTLIYDKRAAGYSLTHRDFSQLADDALAGVALLRARPDVDAAHVGVWGRSEGGWVAPIAAARSADVGFLVVVGANGIAPARQQAWSLTEWQHHVGVTSAGENAFPTTAVRLLAGARLFAQADYDPVAVLRDVRQPVLGIWGGQDRSTPPGEGLTVYRQVLEQSGNPHYTLRIVPDGDHAIHRSTDAGFHRLDELLPGYADLITSWVAQVAAGHAPTPSADTPPVQDLSSRTVDPLQLAAVVLFLLAFLGYPLGALLSRRRPMTGMVPARWLAGAGLAAVVGLLANFVLVDGNVSLGPTVAGRTLAWLVTQVAAVTVVAAAAATAITWRRRAEVNGTARVRLGLLLAAAIVFVPWALYWGLLLP